MKQLPQLNLGDFNIGSLNIGSLKRPYVALMMDVIGRGLEAASQVDSTIQREVQKLPDGFMFDMRALPSGPSLVMEKTADGNLSYIGSEAPRKPDMSLKFKHLNHAFLVVSFQEGTARALANDRILLDGEVAHAMKLVRCLNRMESLILPKFVAVRALKRYPQLSLKQKLSDGGKIYSRLAKNLVWG
ncbi:MAG: hypothetical protein VYA55_10735 [Pseudomonadota bacterium]|nr:hypothetical protein [Pseudomonadota bacterium]